MKKMTMMFNMDCSSMSTHRKSFNGYAPFQKKIYSRLTFIIISTWKHNATFQHIRHWATAHNVSSRILVGGCKIPQQNDDILCVDAQDGYGDLTQKVSKGLNYIYT